MQAGSWQLHCAAGSVPKMYDSHPQDAGQELQERGATIGHHPEAAQRGGGRLSRSRRREKLNEVATGKKGKQTDNRVALKTAVQIQRFRVVVRGLDKQQPRLIYYLMRPRSTARADAGFVKKKCCRLCSSSSDVSNVLFHR